MRFLRLHLVLPDLILFVLPDLIGNLLDLFGFGYRFGLRFFFRLRFFFGLWDRFGFRDRLFLVIPGLTGNLLSFRAEPEACPLSFRAEPEAESRNLR